MFAFEDDIDTMLADSPHTFTAGGVSHPCLFSERDELAEHPGAAPQVVHQVTVLLKTAHFPTLEPEQPCDVNGTAYTVFYAHQVQDGAMTEVQVHKA